MLQLQDPNNHQIYNQLKRKTKDHSIQINYCREENKERKIEKVKEDVELPSIQRKVKAIKGQVKAPEICKPYNQILLFFIRIRAYGIHSLAAFLYPAKLSFEL